MKPRYRLYRRGISGRYYAQDRLTHKQTRLGTCQKSEALRLLNARNESEYLLSFNAQIARTYLSASDPSAGTRTWRRVMQVLIESKQRKAPGTQARYERGLLEAELDGIRDLPLLQTHLEHFLSAVKCRGAVAGSAVF